MKLGLLRNLFVKGVWGVFSIWNGKIDEFNILKSQSESHVMVATVNIYIRKRIEPLKPSGRNSHGFIVSGGEQ